MLELTAHPHTPCAAVRRLRAGVARASQSALSVRYRIEADLERLRIPPWLGPLEGERLWEHTCCELFVAPSAGMGYREFNFSPSGQWAAYAFSRYRDGGPLSAPDPKIAVHRSEDALELQAIIAVEPVRTRLALCAVIEDRDGALSFWALRHPPGKPDFHHREGFALELE